MPVLSSTDFVFIPLYLFTVAVFVSAVLYHKDIKFATHSLHLSGEVDFAKQKTEGEKQIFSPPVSLFG